MWKNSISQDSITEGVFANSVAVNYLVLGEIQKKFFIKKFVISSLGVQFLDYLVKNYSDHRIYLIMDLKFKGKLDFIKKVYNFLNIEIYYYNNNLDELKLLHILNPSLFFTTPNSKVKYKNYKIVDSLFEF